MGVGANDALDLSNAEVLKPLIKAMIFMENSEIPYEDAVIEEGMRLGGVETVERKPSETVDSGFSFISSANAAPRPQANRPPRPVSELFNSKGEVSIKEEEVTGPEDRSVKQIVESVIPANVKAFARYKVQEFFGDTDEETYTEGDFSDGELGALRSIVKWAEAKGKSSITYRDYDEFFGPMKNGLYASEMVAKATDYKLLRETLKKAGQGDRPDFATMMNNTYGDNDFIALARMALDSKSDPAMAVLLTLASVNFHRDKDGNLLIKRDKYDFPKNRNKDTAFNRLRADIKPNDKNPKAPFAFELNLGKK
jgi:hypothetical protein